MGGITLCIANFFSQYRNFSISPKMTAACYVQNIFQLWCSPLLMMSNFLKAEVADWLNLKFGTSC